MKRDVADIYRHAVEDLANAQHAQRSESLKCPFDGSSCCRICEKHLRPVCECHIDESSLAHVFACERMSGFGCSWTHGEGCPKGWVKA